MACNWSQIQPNRSQIHITYIVAFFSAFGCVWLLSNHSVVPWESLKRYYHNYDWTTETEDEVWIILCAFEHDAGFLHVCTCVLSHLASCSHGLLIHVLQMSLEFARLDRGPCSIYFWHDGKEGYRYIEAAALCGIDMATPVIIHSKVLKY